MRRAAWFPSLATVVELWLVAVLLGPGVIYRCPQHDGVPPAMASGDARHVAHRHAASTIIDPRGSTATDQQARHDCGCLCPGDCAGGASQWFPSRTDVVTPLPVVRTALRAARQIVVFRSSHDHLLPFPNGPPTPLSA